MKHIIITLFCFILFPFESSAACAKNNEFQALNTRALQSTLMVAALSCNQQQDYNNVIRKNDALFSKDGTIIKSYFKRNYGRKSENQLNQFVTSLANKAANRSMDSSNSYCIESKDIFNQLRSYNQPKIKEYATQSKYVSLHGIKACK